MRVPIKNLYQFAAERGLITTADVQGHIHAGLRSAPTTKTYDRWNRTKLAELQTARDETTRLYEAAITSGEIETREQTRMERLHEVAAGHPNSTATQAARRLLAKAEAMAEAAE